jgi:hypothetical protein
MKKFILLLFIANSMHTQAQNVGIGTSMPDYPFTLMKNGIGIGHTSTDGSVVIASQVNTPIIGGWVGSFTKVPMHFGAYGSYDVSIMPNGKVGIGVNNPLSPALLEVNGQIKINGGAPADGKVLVSDAFGTATWKNSTKYTSITPPSCQQLANATENYAKLADLGTFTKDNSETNIELNFQTHLKINSLVMSSGVVYEIRIDNLPTTNGNARANVQIANIVTNTSIYGLFTGLATGLHTVSIWARAATAFVGSGGTATGVFYDSGCWNTSNLTVKETF